MKTDSIKIQVCNGKNLSTAVYILSRGQNSGKVLNQPCPNCYAIQAPPEQLAQVQAVAHILFVSGKLKPLLRGSVIKFVTVEAYRSQFLALWRSISPAVVAKTASNLAAIELRQAAIQKQLALLRRSIAFAALK